MTPSEHYAEAERLLSSITEFTEGTIGTDPEKAQARALRRANLIAVAQVHATLATAEFRTAALV